MDFAVLLWPLLRLAHMVVQTIYRWSFFWVCLVPHICNARVLSNVLSFLPNREHLFLKNNQLNVLTQYKMNRAKLLGGQEVFLTFCKLVSECANLSVGTFDPMTGSTTVQTHLIYRQYCTFVNLGNGKVLIVGGRRTREMIYNSVEMLDCKRKLCYPHSPLNSARCAHASCAVGDDIIACGGLQLEGLTKSCEILCPYNRRWIYIPDMLEQRNDFAVVSLRDRRVFIIGGENQNGTYLRSVESCHLPTNPDFLQLEDSAVAKHDFWKYMAPMHEVRGGHSAVVLDEKIIVAGGWYSFSGAACSAEIFMPPSFQNPKGQWCKLDTSMTQYRSKFTLEILSDGLFALGGHNMWNKKSCDRIQIKEELSSAYSGEVQEIFSGDWVALNPVANVRRIWHAIATPKSLFPIS